MLSLPLQLVSSDRDYAMLACDLVNLKYGEQFANDIVVLYHDNGILDIVECSIEKEVRLTSNSNVLFRSNSIAAHIVKAYVMPKISEYLKNNFAELLMELTSDPGDYSLSTLELKEKNIINPQEGVAKNAKAISGKMDKLLAAIENSIKTAPMFALIFFFFLKKHPKFLSFRELRTISHYFRRHVEKKFGDFWLRAVGGFFFLRILCPVFATPNPHIKHATHPNGVKTVLLCTKILQLVANRRKFVDEEMKIMNEYIESKFDFIDSIFEKLSV